MREIQLYDPERQPADWPALLHAGQYAVFHSDVATDVEKRPDGHYLRSGDKSTCLVFDSLPEAETYCEAKVDEIPRLRCDIYDHTGKSRPPMMTYVNKARLKSHKKYGSWGWVFIAGSILCFWWEWARGANRGLALIIGLNMLFAGLRLLYWGTEQAEKRRSTREH